MNALHNLNPFVYWAQNESQITLKVDLKDVKAPNVEVTDKSLRFTANGFGACGLNEYRFYIDLYSQVVPAESSYKVYDSKINVTIKKLENAWWPRITSQPQKPHWLKIDFDRWRTEDDLEEDTARDIMQDYPGMYEKLQKEEYGYIKEQGKKVYLIFYNFAQFIGFLYIMAVMSVLYLRDGYESMQFAFETVGSALKFCQLMQFLEVIHPLLGYTKANIFLKFLQVMERNFILFAIIEKESRIYTHPVVFYLIFLWTLMEIIRYPYYITKLVKNNIHILTWLHRTMWIPLYPLSMFCEGRIVLLSTPYIQDNQGISISLPNKWNFEFSLPIFMKIYLLLLALFGTFVLMVRMAKLRGRKFSGTKICKGL